MKKFSFLNPVNHFDPSDDRYHLGCELVMKLIALGFQIERGEEGVVVATHDEIDFEPNEDEKALLH